MGHGAASSLRSDCSIPTERIHIVGGGVALHPTNASHGHARAAQFYSSGASSSIGVPGVARGTLKGPAVICESLKGPSAWHPPIVSGSQCFPVRQNT